MNDVANNEMSLNDGKNRIRRARNETAGEGLAIRLAAHGGVVLSAAAGCALWLSFGAALFAEGENPHPNYTNPGPEPDYCQDAPHFADGFPRSRQIQGTLALFDSATGRFRPRPQYSREEFQKGAQMFREFGDPDPAEAWPGDWRHDYRSEYFSEAEHRARVEVLRSQASWCYLRAKPGTRGAATPAASCGFAKNQTRRMIRYDAGGLWDGLVDCNAESCVPAPVPGGVGFGADDCFHFFFWDMPLKSGYYDGPPIDFRSSFNYAYPANPGYVDQSDQIRNHDPLTLFIAYSRMLSGKWYMNGHSPGFVYSKERTDRGQSFVEFQHNRVVRIEESLVTVRFFYQDAQAFLEAGREALEAPGKEQFLILDPGWPMPDRIHIGRDGRFAR